MKGIYIHIPFCVSKCTYCDFASFKANDSVIEKYFNTLFEEIKYFAEFNKNRRFSTLYIGGGTPSSVNVKYIEKLIKILDNYYDFESNYEITIEINPGTLTEEKVQKYIDLNITRFSVGMQSSNDKILKDINRIHTKADYLKATKLLKGKNFSTDIMLGLKGQTLQDVYDSIDTATIAGSSHISCYALTVEEKTPIYSDYLKNLLPNDDFVAYLYDEATKKLQANGFMRYEVSNFAKPGFESKHNNIYWQRGEYLGFGLSSASFIDNVRYVNPRVLNDYVNMVEKESYTDRESEKLNEVESRFEYIMLRLRTVKGLKIADFNCNFQCDFEIEYADILSKYSFAVTKQNGYISINSEYLFTQNEILIKFLK